MRPLDHRIKKGSIDSASSIALVNPKFPHNVAGVVRAASCFNATHVLFSGKRVPLNPQNYEDFRLPREERMKGYNEVALANVEKFTSLLAPGVVPVAVEKRRESENLVHFQHPEKALYIFGPEDGSIDKGILGICHRFIYIPTKHCLNLSAAVNLILYDRLSKQETHEDYRFQ